jgi:hypothetical protein
MGDITKTKEVIELGDIDIVNEYLKHKWILLDVHGGHHADTDRVVTIFILGWTNTKKPWQPSTPEINRNFEGGKYLNPPVVEK